MNSRLVIDTNVLVSALLTPIGKPAAVLGRVVSGEFLICYNSSIFAEYEEVLSRPKLRIDAEDRRRLLDILSVMGISVVPIASNIPMADEKDRIFYDTAKMCEALLITGNKRHYPVQPFVLTPAEFLQRCNS